MPPTTSNYPIQAIHDPRVRKILVIKWGALGDMVIASAIFTDLQRAFPNAKLHLNTLPPWLALFAQDTRFEKVISIDLRGELRGLRGFYQWVKTMAREKFDLIIDLQSNDRSLALVSLLRLTTRHHCYRLGVERNHFPYGLSSIRSTTAVHALTRLQCAIAQLGVDPQHCKPQLAIPCAFDSDHPLIRKTRLKHKQYVVFFPGSSSNGQLKRWGADNYAQLAKLLHAQDSLQSIPRAIPQSIQNVVLLGTQEDYEIGQHIAQACGSWAINLCGQTQLLDIAPICAGALAIIGNDNGGVHLAALTDRPIITINGPTDPHVVQPLSQNLQAMRADFACFDCNRKQCAHHSCMRAIKPAAVLTSLNHLLH